MVPCSLNTTSKIHFFNVEATPRFELYNVSESRPFTNARAVHFKFGQLYKNVKIRIADYNLVRGFKTQMTTFVCRHLRRIFIECKEPPTINNFLYFVLSAGAYTKIFKSLCHTKLDS